MSLPLQLLVIQLSGSIKGNNTSIVDVSSTSNPTPQVQAIVASPITTTTDNNSDIETHGAGASTEETYEVGDGPVGNDNNVYESGEGPPSYSDFEIILFIV